MARIDALLRAAREQLDDADAQLLLAHALGRSRAWLYAHASDDCAPDAAARFDVLRARRVAGEPVAYLTGRRGFWTFELDVTPATLIPRAETELLVELALERCPTGPVRVADLGTGSGAIALAVARERPLARVIATDASAAALDVARGNAQQLGLPVEFRHGSWYAPLSGEVFDLLVSNPPYIESSDAHLAQGDLRFEPSTALASGDDGLDALREIAAGARAHLVAGGWLLVEHGWNQGAAVRGLFECAGLDDVATRQDLEGRDRVSLGRAP